MFFHKFGKIARDKRERKGMSLERTAELCEDGANGWRQRCDGFCLAKS